MGATTVQWLIDMLKDWVDQQGFLTTSLINRGDPASADFSAFTMIADDAWHELDLSAIVPAGAKGVLMFVDVGNANAGKHARFRPHGNVNEFNVSSLVTQVGGLFYECDRVCLIDADRHIDYYFSAGAWIVRFMTIKGWWF